MLTVKVAAYVAEFEPATRIEWTGSPQSGPFERPVEIAQNLPDAIAAGVSRQR